jgi:hypothetical protein
MTETNNDRFAFLMKLSDENPDECLNTISTLLASDESLNNNPLVLVARGFAFFGKAARSARNQDAWTDDLVDLLEAGLKDFKLVDDLAPNMKIFEEFKDKIDAGCLVVDGKRPGNVQSIIGKTKLKFFMGGEDRFSVNTSCAEFLIPSDKAIELFSDIYFSYPKIVRSALIFYMQKDEKNRHYLYVTLFEKPYLKNAFGEVSEIAGYIKIFEDGEIKIEGDEKKGKTEEKPTKRGFFSKVFK